MRTTNGFSRRTALVGTATLATALACPPVRPAKAASSLNWVASRNGLHFGSAVQLTHLQEEPDLVAALARECAAIVPEWEMKWRSMESRRGRVNYWRCDAMVDIARNNGLWIRGHTALWHRNLPDWVEEALAQSPEWSIVEDRIRGLMSRYGPDIIPEWDVLNEIVEPEDGRRDGLRQNVFLSAFGFDYITRSLEIAREVAPQTRLYINEYGLDYNNCTARARRRAMLRLVRKLRRRDAPLDAIGIQAHLRPGAAPFSARALRRFLRRLADMGVKISITELDVREQDMSPSVAERDRIVADEVRRYLDVVLDEPAVIGVSTWGLSDRHSWLTSAAMHEENRVNRGLPLDTSLAQKPMYQAIERSLRRAAPR